ncbi:sodium channel modifier 1 isoform X3 [Malaclemys terrapin pileata]|uniref:sodium channel modifier 1 isoform X3 n=1 Tax=Malaclemys terrapin pileata TaxID=2991368 RepID=UPI0023A8C7FC|nr:sodium channel modifier 1 isoform X3 [Malaclemys terrapin pileata]
MSFKREGDDSGQLNVLQKRRVADLLANYIPEDEALLLRNGRYACTVCFHRPVFDTLDMLTVHRAGKKHVASLQTFYGKKRSRENEVQKRRQQEFLRAEEAGTQDLAHPAPLLAQTRKIAQNALLKASPYNSCCRRNRPDGSGSSVSSSRTEPAAPAAFGSAVGKQPAEPGSSVARGEEGCAVADIPHSTRLPGHASPRADLQKEPAARIKRSSKRKSSLSAQPGAISPEKRQALEHYLLLRRLDPGPFRQVGERRECGVRL